MDQDYLELDYLPTPMWKQTSAILNIDAIRLTLVELDDESAWQKTGETITICPKIKWLRAVAVNEETLGFFCYKTRQLISIANQLKEEPSLQHDLEKVLTDPIMFELYCDAIGIDSDLLYKAMNNNIGE